MGNSSLCEHRRWTQDHFLQMSTNNKYEQSTFQQSEAKMHSQYLIHMRVLTQMVLNEFKKQGEDVGIFMKEMKNMLIIRGQNFEGKVNKDGNLVGIGKFFKRNNDECNMFFGQCKNGKPIGRGINIKCNMIPIKNEAGIRKGQKLDKQSYQAQLLDDWNLPPEEIQTGAVIKKDGKMNSYFKGQIQNRQFYKGKITVKEYQNTKLEYTGQFKNNNIDGQGELIVPGKYRYKGNFLRQMKDGIGEEFDELRQTYYIGQFENNKRHGYGQLTYLNRDNVKLMGFWTEGIMKAGDGVYIGKDEAYLQAIGDDIQLI